MIDCHAHLASPRFDADRRRVVERATEAGIRHVLVVGEDLEDNRRVLAVCKDFPGTLLPCVGLHPDRYADDRPLPTEDELAAIEALARQHAAEIACIGEVGLDYHYVKDHARRDAQRQGLERMAALARELGIPLNVHSRSAGHYTIEALVEAGAERVLMHAFDGKPSYAKRAAECGYIFSIPPSVVRSEQKQKLIRALPLESLAFESDSPVLGPERRKRNEPENIRLVAQAIAAAHATTEDRVREIADQNARRLFARIPASAP